MPKIKQNLQKGDGIFKDVVDYFLPTRSNFPPKVRRILQKYSNNKITNINVGRSPIQSYVTKLLNYLSLGKFDEQAKNLNYDDVYHLFMIITLDNGINLLVEKNEVIKIIVVSPTYISKAKDVLNIPINKSIDLGTLIKNTVDRVGPSIYLYDHVNNNCQFFIENILKSNGLDSSQATNFIMQDVESLLSKSPQYVNSLARFATESSAKLNRLVEGEGKKKKRGRPKKSNTYISKTNKRIKKIK